jgi:hypothetical protein
MPVPFGFSAGDIAMAIKFTIQMANALKETGGAASEYQQAFEYWKYLLVTYQQLQHLRTHCMDSTLLEEIRGIAMLAEEPIHNYIQKIHGDFGSALSTKSSRSSLTQVLKKAKWTLHAAGKEEKLRQQMSARLQTVHVKFEQLNLYKASNNVDEQKLITPKRWP